MFSLYLTLDRIRVNLIKERERRKSVMEVYDNGDHKMHRHIFDARSRTFASWQNQKSEVREGLRGDMHACMRAHVCASRGRAWGVEI